MKRNHSIVAASVASAALAAVITLAGGGAANASPPSPAGTAPATQSCWIDATTEQSLCVPTGDDLLAAVQNEDGVTIDIPAGASVSGNVVTGAQSLVTTLTVNAADTTEAVSIIYDDINYGGGSLIMTSDTGCDAGIATLVPLGWNDRASSFKSYNGCLTALYQNINYGGVREGYDSSKASFGSQNDQGSSWATE